MVTLSITEKLETLHCAKCDILFAIPASFQNARRNDHGNFYCPNNHTNYYPDETDEEKMRRERDIAKQQLARVEEENKAAIRQRDEAKMAAAGAVKRTKQLTERAAAGVCPCCTRTVRQLALHMKTKHPEFIAEEITNVVPIKKVAGK